MIKIETVGKPYMRYLAKVIPLAFDESMSYYEFLCNVYNYLKNEVAPVINNNAEALEELRLYVENYFDNLDIQEEVDNKLDEMYENGQLQSLIEEFIDLTVTFTYPTVADMKLATNLTNGQYTRTIGFYSNNDNGGATYRIRTITSYDTIDEVTIIALNDPTLIAELIITNEMNVKQFGAKGDGETDDTDSIQLAFDNCHNLIINNGVYMVDASEGIKPNSNTNIKIVNATIKALPNNLTNYNIMLISNKENINIEGGIIQGERDDHTGVTGEWGMCITINNESKNITLTNMKLIDGWGDGLYISNATNVKVKNIIIDNNRRNGISLINGDYIVIEECEISNTNGTLPECAIDLEPNEDDTLTNVTIKNCYIHDNKMGIGCYNAYYETLPNAVNNVNIINNIFDDHTSEDIKLENVNNENILNNIINDGTIGIRMINASNIIVKNNQINQTDGSGITLATCNKIIVNNNIINGFGDSNDAGVIATNSKISDITNNIIHDGQTSGILIQGTGDSISELINISYNKIYNCNLKQASYYDMQLKLNVERCTVTNNDMRTVDNAYTRACIVATDNPNPTNFIAYNIMNPKLVTTLNIGSNKTCDNIVSNVLYLGNITRQ